MLREKNGIYYEIRDDEIVALVDVKEYATGVYSIRIYTNGTTTTLLNRKEADVTPENIQNLVNKHLEEYKPQEEEQ